MAGHDFRIGIANQFISSLGDEFMGSPMSAVTADMIFFSDIRFNTVSISFRRHGQMEGSIENGNHGNAGHKFLTGAHTHNMSGVMERSHGEGCFHILDGFFRCNRGLGEESPAVHVTMADTVDFFEIGDDAVIFVYESVEHHFNGDVMIFNVRFDFVFVFAGGFVGKQGVVQTDAIHKAFGHNAFIIHINELIFQRRTAAVQH